MQNDDEFLKNLAEMPNIINSSSKIDVSLEDEPLNDEIDDNENLLENSESDITQTDLDIIPKEIDDKQNELEDIDSTYTNNSIQNADSQADKTQEYILDSCKKLMNQGYETLSNLQDTVISTADGKTINGYATLIGNLGKILDTVNNIAMNKQRMAHQAKIEMLKNHLKSKMISTAPQKTQNTINIVAGREEIMKMLDNQI